MARSATRQSATRERRGARKETTAALGHQHHQADHRQNERSQKGLQRDAVRVDRRRQGHGADLPFLRDVLELSESVPTSTASPAGPRDWRMSPRTPGSPRSCSGGATPRPTCTRSWAATCCGPFARPATWPGGSRRARRRRSMTSRRRRTSERDQSVFRYSMRSARSGSLSLSPKVWPPLPRPNRDVS